jgi:hypothetical protein
MNDSKKNFMIPCIIFADLGADHHGQAMQLKSRRFIPFRRAAPPIRADGGARSMVSVALFLLGIKQVVDRVQDFIPPAPREIRVAQDRDLLRPFRLVTRSRYRRRGALVRLAVQPSACRPVLVTENGVLVGPPDGVRGLTQ